MVKLSMFLSTTIGPMDGLQPLTQIDLQFQDMFKL